MDYCIGTLALTCCSTGSGVVSKIATLSKNWDNSQSGSRKEVYNDV